MEQEIRELVQKFIRQGQTLDAIKVALTDQVIIIELAEPLIQAKEEMHKAP
jgi:hypothetical protein